ncbi:MAG: hypothetical protein V4598_06505 [Bdellovibrionota bacterium]
MKKSCLSLMILGSVILTGCKGGSGSGSNGNTSVETLGEGPSAPMELNRSNLAHFERWKKTLIKSCTLESAFALGKENDDYIGIDSSLFDHGLIPHKDGFGLVANFYEHSGNFRRQSRIMRDLVKKQEVTLEAVAAGSDCKIKVNGNLVFSSKIMKAAEVASVHLPGESLMVEIEQDFWTTSDKVNKKILSAFEATEPKLQKLLKDTYNMSEADVRKYFLLTTPLVLFKKENFWMKEVVGSFELRKLLDEGKAIELEMNILPMGRMIIPMKIRFSEIQSQIEISLHQGPRMYHKNPTGVGEAMDCTISLASGGYYGNVSYRSLFMDSLAGKCKGLDRSIVYGVNLNKELMEKFDRAFRNLETSGSDNLVLPLWRELFLDSIKQTFLKSGVPTVIKAESKFMMKFLQNIILVEEEIKTGRTTSSRRYLYEQAAKYGFINQSIVF